MTPTNIQATRRALKKRAEELCAALGDGWEPFVLHIQLSEWKTSFSYGAKQNGWTVRELMSVHETKFIRELKGPRKSKRFVVTVDLFGDENDTLTLSEWSSSPIHGIKKMSKRLMKIMLDIAKKRPVITKGSVSFE